MDNYLTIKQVCWVSTAFEIATTIEVGGLYYTFGYEIESENLPAILDTIIERLEFWEEDGATTEVSHQISSILYEHEHVTNIILN